jgi:hypothetical protein
MALQTLLFNRFAAPAFENIGVFVSDAEAEEYITSTYRDLREQYASSELTPEQIDMLLSINWSRDMHFVAQQLANEKFMNILTAGHYLNKLEVAQALRQDKLTLDGSYVEIPYTAIADEEVEVTDEEVQAYYEAHRKENAKMGSRTIRYVRFDRQATEQDKKAIEDEVMALDAKVAEAANADAIKNAVRAAGGKVQSYYTAYESLQPEVAEAFKAGKGYGPVAKGNVWTARYLLSDVNAPESYEVEVAIYPEIAKAEQAADIQMLSLVATAVQGLAVEKRATGTAIEVTADCAVVVTFVTNPINAIINNAAVEELTGSLEFSTKFKGATWTPEAGKWTLN